MSLYDYQASLRIQGSFYAVIMAAMRRADTTNQHLLQSAFPDVWKELKARYNAPDGLLPDEEEGLA